MHSRTYYWQLKDRPGKTLPRIWTAVALFALVLALCCARETRSFAHTAPNLLISLLCVNRLFLFAAGLECSFELVVRDLRAEREGWGCGRGWKECVMFLSVQNTASPRLRIIRSARRRKSSEIKTNLGSRAKEKTSTNPEKTSKGPKEHTPFCFLILAGQRNKRRRPS